jgi:MFS family permease
MTPASSLFSRRFLQLWLANTTVLLTYYSLLVCAGPFVTERYRATPAMAGLATGLTVIGVLVTRAASGYLWGRFSAKQLMVAGMAALVPVLAAYEIDAGIGFVLALRFMHGMAVGLIATVTNTAVVFVLPPARKGEGIGYFTLSNIVATAIGPFFGLLIVHTAGYGLLFGVETLLGVAGWITVVKSDIPDPPPRPREARQTAAGQPWYMTAIEPAAVPLSLVMMWVALGYAAVQADLALLTAERGLNAYASAFFLIYATVILATRPQSGKVMDRFSEHHVVYPAMLLFALGLATIGQAASGTALLIAGGLCGLGFGNVQSAFQATIAKTTPPHRLSQANSTYFILFDLSLGIGPYLLGLAVPWLGFERLFEALAVTTLIGVPLYYAAHHSRRRRQRAETG